HLQHAAYGIEAAHGLLHAREAVQHGVSRRQVRFLGRDVPPDGPDVAADAVDTGRLAGRLNDIAVAHRRHVVTDGTRRIGKCETECLQLVLDMRWQWDPFEPWLAPRQARRR